MKLADLKQLSTVSVSFRGQPLELRAVTMREEEAILRAMPEPQPRGETAAQRQADLMSPEFSAMRDTWRNKTAAAKAGVAAGFQNSAGESYKVDRGDRWIQSWTDEIFSCLTVNEIDFILREVRKAEGLFVDERDLIGTGTKPGLLICPPIPKSWSEAEAEPVEFKLPARYSETELSALLRAAERFGVDPVLALEWPPDIARLAHLFNVLRTAEEHEAKKAELRLIAAACGAKVE